jgi:hypothetical protein
MRIGRVAGGCATVQSETEIQKEDDGNLKRRGKDKERKITIITKKNK